MSGKKWYNTTMQIVRVDKTLIKKFVEFPDLLYKGDDNYVPYMKTDLSKTLKRLVLKEKRYTALLATEGKKVLARVLFTVDKNKQLHTEKCCFFSMFECVDDVAVCKMLFDELRRLAAQAGAEYVSGTYFPFDQDNRRGILCHGFERPPLIFTSYNKPYYDKLLTCCGLQKQTDAYEYEIDVNGVDDDRLANVAKFSMKKYDFRVDTVDWNNLERDISDVHKVMQEATNEIIFQDAPTIENLRSIVTQWKAYLNKDFILIARSNKDDSPLGIAMALPDFFQVFRKMRGKTDLKGILAFLSERRKIRSYRAIMQYVVPKYQNKGAIVALYNKMNQNAKRYGVTYMEAGTIMENNVQSNSSIVALGGKLARVYRIYFGKLEK